MVGFLSQHVCCFKLLLAGSVLSTIAPLLTLASISQWVAAIGIALLGLAEPLGTIPSLQAMETVHARARGEAKASSETKQNIFRLWLGLWAIAGNVSAVMAGIFMDYMTFNDMGILLAVIEGIGTIIALVIMLNYYYRSTPITSPETSP